MSIASEITRLQGAKSSIKTAIEAKGVTVPSNALLDSFSTYIAQISGGGSTGLEYEEGTFEPTSDAQAPIINFSNSHSKLPALVIMCDSTNDYSATTNSFASWYYISIEALFGAISYVTSTDKQYGYVLWRNRGYSSTSFSWSTLVNILYPNNTTNTSTASPRYYVTETGFIPRDNSMNSTRYWRTGRTYKWIAIWK